MQAQPVGFTRTYDETLTMIVEARNYMTHVEPRVRRQITGNGSLRFSCEALRVTSRLTQVLAWLMMQRAVAEGEISQEDALAEKNLLAGQEVCLDRESGEDQNLPDGLRDLLERSYRLYERVMRLEKMALSRFH